MSDPVTVLGAVALVSSLAGGGCVVKAAKASVDLARAQGGVALREIFDCGPDIPEDMAKDLQRLS